MREKIYIKLSLAIIVSLIFSNFLINNFFVAKTPFLRPNLKDYLVTKIKNTTNDFLAKIFRKNITPSPEKNIVEEVRFKLADIPFKKLSRGVYGKTNGKEALIEIDTSEMEFVEYSFNIKGKVIKIKIPKDTQPPPSQVIERLFSE